jgi:hypothetical protein
VSGDAAAVALGFNCLLRRRNGALQPLLVALQEQLSCHWTVLLAVLAVLVLHSTSLGSLLPYSPLPGSSLLTSPARRSECCFMSVRISIKGWLNIAGCPPEPHMPEVHTAGAAARQLAEMMIVRGALRSSYLCALACPAATPLVEILAPQVVVLAAEGPSTICNRCPRAFTK